VLLDVVPNARFESVGPGAVRAVVVGLLVTLTADQLEAINWHIAFEQIHPFPDGNGRIGRLLYRWHCTELDVAPLIWRESDREAYLALVQSSVDLERANDGDRE
jgi:fido (protein-threonine AMPylation protein)